MACSHHNHHHHQSPACCCSHRCITPPPPPAIDPVLLESIVSQHLRNPQIAHLHSSAPSPAFSAAAFAASRFDLHPCFSQQQTQKHPKQKHKQPHPSPPPFEDQFHDQYSVLSSLLQRIDILESSVNRFSAPFPSSATAFSLRHVAARTIQIHFRAHLARRSRTLSELKELASIKSALNLLKSSLSLQKRLDFSSLSHDALHLIRRLDAIESGDQMVRDSKSSIGREIARFLGLVDEICAKRNEVSLKTVKHIKLVMNDDKSRVSCAGRESSGAYHRVKALKHSNSDSDEKKLIANLRERVERIQHISKVFGDVEDSADSEDGNDVRGSKNYTDRCQTGHITGKHRSQSHAEKRVWFQEDGNATRGYNIHEDEEVPMRSVSGNVSRREDSVDKQHEEDREVESDSEENDAEAAEGSECEYEPQNASLESSSLSSDEAEEVSRKYLTNESKKKVNPSHVCRDGKLILSAPPPVKMEGRADLVKKQKGVKMVG